MFQRRVWARARETWIKSLVSLVLRRRFHCVSTQTLMQTLTLISRQVCVITNLVLPLTVRHLPLRFCTNAELVYPWYWCMVLVKTQASSVSLMRLIVCLLWSTSVLMVLTLSAPWCWWWFGVWYIVMNYHHNQIVRLRKSTIGASWTGHHSDLEADFSSLEERLLLTLVYW